MIITYIAKRSLQSGVTAGDVIILTVPLSASGFTPSPVVSESSITSIGGAPQISLKHYYTSWSITTTYDDTNSKADYDQFFKSVYGGARFSITDYDDDDEDKNVIMLGSESLSSQRRFNAGEFNYSFTVREV